MSWQDPQGGWAKAQRRRTIAFKYLLIASPIFLLAPFLVLVFLTTLHPLYISPLVLVPLVFWVPPLLWRYRVERTIAQMVPWTDGRICPICRLVLAELPHAGQCPKCGQAYTFELLRRYWEEYALNPRGIKQVFAEMNASPSATGPRFSIPHMQRRMFASMLQSQIRVALVMTLLLAVLGVAVIIQADDRVEGLVRMVQFAGIPLGSIILSFGLKRHVGEERFCASCDYQQPPEGATPQRCPECGAQWNLPGGLRHGRGKRTPWKIWLGATLLAISVGIPLVQLSRTLMKQTPTAATRPTGTSLPPGTAQPAYRLPPAMNLSVDQLIVKVTDPKAGFTNSEWSELLTRTLTPAEDNSLAEGLLDYRLARGHLTDDAEAWFTLKLKRGGLPDALVERYYREMLEVSLVAPPQATIGAGPFVVTIAGTNRTNIYYSRSGADRLFVYFDGFYLDDSGEPVNRVTRPIPAGLLISNPKYTPRITMTPDLPGRRRIRAVMWCAAVPPNAEVARPAHWQAIGEPQLPADATWTKRIELEQVVEIAE